MFAVPGEITSGALGGDECAAAHGATALTSSADVLEAFGISPVAHRHVELSSPAELVLCGFVIAPAAPDELTRELAVPAAEVATALAELELATLVDEQAGVYRATSATRLFAQDAHWLDEPAPAIPAEARGRSTIASSAAASRAACALALAEAGKRVRVYDARAIAGGASGRIGGFALRGTPLRPRTGPARRVDRRWLLRPRQRARLHVRAPRGRRDPRAPGARGCTFRSVAPALA